MMVTNKNQNKPPFKIFEDSSESVHWACLQFFFEDRDNNEHSYISLVT